MKRLIVRVVGVAIVISLAFTGVLMRVIAAKVVSSPVTQQPVITDLHMSDSFGGPAKLLFPVGTETVYVVFEYSGMQGEEWRIVVIGPGGVILYDETRSYMEEGIECITITHPSGPIPSGAYQTQIYLGTFPSMTLLWHVRPGGPGEITNLRMSISSNGPPTTEFIEGIQPVWAIFDYANMQGNEVGVDVFEGDERIRGSPRVSLTGSGTKAISVTHRLAAGFPAGQYRTHVVKDEFVDGIEYWSVGTEGATSTPTPTLTPIPATPTATPVPSTSTPTPVPATPTSTPEPPTATPTSAPPTPTLAPGQPTPTPMPPTPTPMPPTPTPVPPTATPVSEQPYPTPMPPTPTLAPGQPTLTPTTTPPMATATEMPLTPTPGAVPPTTTPVPSTAEATVSEPSTPSPTSTTALPTSTTALTLKSTPAPTATSSTTKGTGNFLVVAGYVGVAVVLVSLALFLWQRRSS